MKQIFPTLVINIALYIILCLSKCVCVPLDVIVRSNLPTKKNVTAICTKPEVGPVNYLVIPRVADNPGSGDNVTR